MKSLLLVLLLLPGVTAARSAPATSPATPPTITVQTTTTPPPADAAARMITAPAILGKPHFCPNKDYYPPDAKAEHVEGRTAIAFTVATDGSIKNITVDKSSGDDRLDRAALRCAKNWDGYQPAMQNGVPVEVPWKAVVLWSLGPNMPQPDGSSIIPIATGAKHICPASTSNTDPPLRALLAFTIEPDGNVTKTEVILSSGNAGFDASAIACVGAWRWQPRLVNGQPVQMVWRAWIP